MVFVQAENLGMDPVPGADHFFGNLRVKRLVPAREAAYVDFVNAEEGAENEKKQEVGERVFPEA